MLVFVCLGFFAVIVWRRWVPVKKSLKKCLDALLFPVRSKNRSWWGIACRLTILLGGFSLCLLTLEQLRVCRSTKAGLIKRKQGGDQISLSAIVLLSSHLHPWAEDLNLSAKVEHKKCGSMWEQDVVLKAQEGWGFVYWQCCCVSSLWGVCIASNCSLPFSDFCS